MAGQVYAVASGKGGVGKTTTVVNLGVVLRRADHTVVLVDADLGMANLGTMVGVEGETTLHDVLADTSSVEDAVVEEAPGFAVLVGSADLSAYPTADPEAMGPVLETLAESYDFVLVDTGAGMSHEDVLPLGLADRVLLVTTPDPAAIGDTRKTAELAGLARGSISGVVVTMVDDATDVDEVADQVGVELLGAVPYDPTVRRSTAAATPLEAVAPESPAAEAYRDLASVLVGGAVDAVTPPPTAEPSSATAAATRGAEAGDDVHDGPGRPAGTSETPSEEPTAGGESAAGEATADVVEAAATPDEPGSDAADEPDIAAGTRVEEAGEADGGTDEGDSGGSAPDEEIPEAGTESATADADEDGGGEAAETGADDADDDDDDLDDYLEEFEDVEPAPSGGLFARIRRWFR